MKRFSLLACILLFALAGCAGSRPVPGPAEEYVEIDNPAATMSPSAPATIWVPRRYVESGIPRGGELVKKGYEAAITPRVIGEAPPPPAKEGEGHVYARYYRVLLVEKERVCFNADRSAGIKQGARLRLYRGGSVVDGIGFVPGTLVGAMTIIEPAGAGSTCGNLEPGGEAGLNDLVKAE